MRLMLRFRVICDCVTCEWSAISNHNVTGHIFRFGARWLSIRLAFRLAWPTVFGRGTPRCAGVYHMPGESIPHHQSQPNHSNFHDSRVSTRRVERRDPTALRSRAPLLSPHTTHAKIQHTSRPYSHPGYV